MCEEEMFNITVLRKMEVNIQHNRNHQILAKLQSNRNSPCTTEIGGGSVFYFNMIDLRFSSAKTHFYPHHRMWT